MNKHLLAVTAAATFGIGVWQTASAADLPRRPEYQAPAMVAPVQSWTGCYIGGNIGAAWGSAKIENVTGAGSVTPSNNGFIAGGQIGCDYQAGPWVFGIRNLGDWSNLDKRSGIAGGTFNGFSVALRTTGWTFDRRVGYSMEPIWLLYFQGGGAWRNSDVQLFNIAGTQVGEVSKTRTGWTIGAGSEYKFAPNWSVFLEYNMQTSAPMPSASLFRDVGNFSVTSIPMPILLLTGVNWRF